MLALPAPPLAELAVNPLPPEVIAELVGADGTLVFVTTPLLNALPSCAAPGIEPVPAALPVGERFDALLVSVGDNDVLSCVASGVEPVPAALPVRERFDALSVLVADGHAPPCVSPGVDSLPAPPLAELAVNPLALIPLEVIAVLV